jgi:hydroxymethylpyrimidine pyrophosphatase-like HAD family hydrolase
MKRRVIAFDLDNTLADSKSPITEQMADLLNGLLKRFQVCAISGDSGRGNDYPVNAMGVDCLEVSNWQDTALVIQTILV